MNLRNVQIGKYLLCVDADVQPGQIQSAGLQYERHVQAEIERVLTGLDSGTFVDVGANAGIHSVCAKNANPKITVVAIEVSDANVALLCQTVVQNHFKDFAVIPVAASSYVGVIFRNGCAENTTCALTKQDPYPTAWPCLTLDSLNLRNIKLVKVDVEGLEPLVFRGMHQLIVDQHPPIIFEFTPHRYVELGMRPVDVIRYLADFGYRFVVLDYLPNIRKEFDNPDEVVNYVQNVLGLDILDIMAVMPS